MVEVEKKQQKSIPSGGSYCCSRDPSARMTMAIHQPTSFPPRIHPSIQRRIHWPENFLKSAPNNGISLLLLLLLLVLIIIARGRRASSTLHSIPYATKTAFELLLRRFLFDSLFFLSSWQCCNDTNELSFIQSKFIQRLLRLLFADPFN